MAKAQRRGRRRRSSSSDSSESESETSGTTSSNSSSSDSSSSQNSSDSDSSNSRSRSKSSKSSKSSSSYHTYSDSSDDEHEGDMRALERRICKELREMNYILVRLILKEIGDYGVAKMMLKQVHRLEKGKGIRTADNKRRKSPGGVFFHLAQNRLGAAKFRDLNKQCDKIKKEKM